MNYIQHTQPFSVLKPYFLPAIYHHVVEGRKKLYQLSISFEGKEQIIKKSSKQFFHTGFNKVIAGAVVRMQTLFKPDKLNLEVILYSEPTINNLKISFELVNKNKFIIGNEEYYATIMAQYDYSKMGVVTYYPIIYRQVCSNGMVAVMLRNFSETISVENIFKIGCEWTRCNFETYQRNLANYFESLKNTVEENKIGNNDFENRALRKMERVLKMKFTDEKQLTDSIAEDSSRNPSATIRNNINELGYSEFAIWNAITDFASREPNLETRNQMFLNAGKYLAGEVEKMLEKNQSEWSENLYWDEVANMAKG